MSVWETTPLNLTTLQRNAVLMILVDYCRQKDATQEWEDVVSGEVVHLSDLVGLFASPIVWKLYEPGE